MTSTHRSQLYCTTQGGSRGWSTYRTMDGSQEWLRRTRVGSRAQPTGRMVASSQDWPGSAYRHRHRLGYLGCSLHRRGRHMEEQLDRTVQVLSTYRVGRRWDAETRAKEVCWPLNLYLCSLIFPSSMHLLRVMPGKQYILVVVKRTKSSILYSRQSSLVFNMVIFGSYLVHL
jgi:hypothetical protein